MAKQRTHPGEKRTSKQRFEQIAVKGGATVAMLGALTLAACATPATSSPTSSSSETATPAPEVLTEKSFEIPAGLTPEQTAIAIQTNISKAIFGGANQDLAVRYHALGGGPESYAIVQKAAQNNVAMMAQGMFLDSATNDAVKPYISYTLEEDAAELELWGQTYIPSDPSSAFTHTTEYVPGTLVSKQDASGLTMTYETLDKSNAASVPNIAPIALTYDGSKHIVTVTLQTVNSLQKISAIRIDNK
ncbi:MAG: hypothetical protein JWP19_2222 [Rhodoglobus sp.]|nr:hypothetical protein [Rhodoglobus sp.]